jgi:hypothetical protein
MTRLAVTLLLFSSIFFNNIQAVKIKLVSEILIDEKTILLEKPSSFIKTTHGSYIIADYQAGDLKQYLADGKFLNTYGRKGQGPNEFLSPFAISYYPPQLSILDIDRRMIFILNCSDDGTFNSIDYFSCPGGAEKISLSNDRITISGYLVDSEEMKYSIYQYILKTKEIIPIIPRYQIFGYSSQDEYEKHFADDIAPLGMRVLCAQYRENVYAIWDRNLKIFKKNSKTKDINFFGEKTRQFIPLKNTKEFHTAYKNKNIKKLQEMIHKCSFISTIAATDKYFILIYHNIKDSKKYVYVQFYDNTGDFLEEKELPLPSRYGMFYISPDAKNIYELCDDILPTEVSHKIRIYAIDSGKN